MSIAKFHLIKVQLMQKDLSWSAYEDEKRKIRFFHGDYAYDLEYKSDQVLVLHTPKGEQLLMSDLDEMTFQSDDIVSTAKAIHCEVSEIISSL